MIDIYSDLAGLKLPVYQQGTAPEKLPKSFYTVWEDYSADNLNGDNRVKEIRHEWTLIYYTKDFATIYSGMQSAIDTLKAKGYIISGAGYDFNGTYGEWNARAVDVKKIEKIGGQNNV